MNGLLDLMWRCHEINNKKAVRGGFFGTHETGSKKGIIFKMMFGWFNNIGTVYLKLLSQT